MNREAERKICAVIVDDEELARQVLGVVDRADPLLVRDRRRADTLREEREAAAQAYFQAHASEWDRIRSLHVAEAEVEGAISDVLGPGPFNLFVDLGTGTGRMLELLRARYQRPRRRAAEDRDELAASHASSLPGAEGPR